MIALNKVILGTDTFPIGGVEFNCRFHLIGQSRWILINTWLQPGELPDGKHRITVLTVFRAPVVTDALRFRGITMARSWRICKFPSTTFKISRLKFRGLEGIL